MIIIIIVDVANTKGLSFLVLDRVFELLLRKVFDLLYKSIRRVSRKHSLNAFLYTELYSEFNYAHTRLHISFGILRRKVIGYKNFTS